MERLMRKSACPLKAASAGMKPAPFSKLAQPCFARSFRGEPDEAVHHAPQSSGVARDEAAPATA
jgi:hypothetical protein